jgi:hypothetical protein
LGIGCGGYRLPLHATSAEPGSPEKVAVLEARAKRRVSLFHPADRRDSIEPSCHRPQYYRLSLPRKAVNHYA